MSAMISTWEVMPDGKILVKTPYCGAVVDQCRKWAGKWSRPLNGWVVSGKRLPDVVALLGDPATGTVEVEVRQAMDHLDDPQQYPNGRPGYTVEDNAYVLGWHVLASRPGRDSAAEVHAELVAGEIPDYGGSVKNPLVSGKGCAFRLTIPRDLADRLGVPVVVGEEVAAKPEPVPFAPVATLPEATVKALSVFSNAEIQAEFFRRFGRVG